MINCPIKSSSFVERDLLFVHKNRRGKKLQPHRIKGPN